MNDKALRDLLMPGLWAISSKFKKNAELHVDKYGISVSTGGKNVSIISRDEIEDGSFKYKYGPRVHEIMEDGEWHYER